MSFFGQEVRMEGEEAATTSGAGETCTFTFKKRSKNANIRKRTLETEEGADGEDAAAGQDGTINLNYD